MGRVALYAGSFDPVTLGHLDVIRRGAWLFDKLVVGVGVNPSKRYWFSEGERVRMLESVCADLPNVRVTVFRGLLVDAARTEGVDVILRGLRVLSDFDMEFRYGLANRDLGGLETLFILTDPRYIFVSSSLIKEIATNGGTVDRYVPEVVRIAVAAHLSESVAP